MESFINEKISKEWQLSQETIENIMANDKRVVKILEDIVSQGNEGANKATLSELRTLMASKTFRPYSIILEPTTLKRRATTNTL